MGVVNDGRRKSGLHSSVQLDSTPRQPDLSPSVPLGMVWLPAGRIEAQRAPQLKLGIHEKRAALLSCRYRHQRASAASAPPRSTGAIALGGVLLALRAAPGCPAP